MHEGIQRKAKGGGLCVKGEALDVSEQGLIGGPWNSVHASFRALGPRGVDVADRVNPSVHFVHGQA